MPAELIRPKSPALGKRILLEYVPFIWNRLKFLHKVCLRNIFRYKKRFFMMVLGICGFANMWLAVFADVGVAMLAILNAMRAMKMKQ